MALVRGGADGLAKAMRHAVAMRSRAAVDALLAAGVVRGDSEGLRDVMTQLREETVMEEGGYVRSLFGSRDRSCVALHLQEDTNCSMAGTAGGQTGGRNASQLPSWGASPSSGSAGEGGGHLTTVAAWALISAAMLVADWLCCCCAASSARTTAASVAR